MISDFLYYAKFLYKMVYSQTSNNFLNHFIKFILNLIRSTKIWHLNELSLFVTPCFIWRTTWVSYTSAFLKSRKLNVFGSINFFHVTWKVMHLHKYQILCAGGVFLINFSCFINLRVNNDVIVLFKLHLIWRNWCVTND